MTRLSARIRFACGALLVASPLAAAVPPPGPPQTGPIERAPRPIVLILYPQRIAPINPFATGLVGGVLKGLSDDRYDAAARRTGEAVRASVPALNLEQEVRASFRCGEPGSMCSEMVLLEAAANELYPTRASIVALLNARQWTQARTLSIWWDQEEKGRLAAHASMTDVALDGTQLDSSYPVYSSYFITQSKSAGGVHDDEWELGAPMPRESALRAALAQLEPMLQLSYSWGANNDPLIKQRIEGRPLVLKYRDQGIECKEVKVCNVVLDSVVGDRTWSWYYLGREGKLRTYLVVLRSRSVKAP